MERMTAARYRVARRNEGYMDRQVQQARHTEHSDARLKSKGTARTKSRSTHSMDHGNAPTPEGSSTAVSNHGAGKYANEPD
jgi:hypothetical protein